MKKIIFFLLFFFLIASVTSIILFIESNSELLLTLSITFCTFLYHFAMRLFIGALFNCKYNKKMYKFYKYNNYWFKEKPFEKNLYKKLKVKQWKEKMPTYSPETFDLQKNSTEEIITSTCQAEFIHEINAILSFVPLLAAIPFGTFYVFLFTSIGSAFFELIFVIIQRFNRPRLIYFSLINK